VIRAIATNCTPAKPNKLEIDVGVRRNSLAVSDLHLYLRRLPPRSLPSSPVYSLVVLNEKNRIATIRPGAAVRPKAALHPMSCNNAAQGLYYSGGKRMRHSISHNAARFSMGISPHHGCSSVPYGFSDAQECPGCKKLGEIAHECTCIEAILIIWP